LRRVPFLDQLGAWDAAAAVWAQQLRWPPLTPFFVLVSTWWVKWPLFLAAGAAADAVRRSAWPRVTCAAAASVGLAALAVTLLKDTADRLRPPLADAHVQALVAIPQSASFPSGHAATAFAAATALALLVPRLRVPALAVAALVAFSRVYLGVHYVLDVVAGATLGIAVGVSVALLVRRARLVPA
jgi:undecaprenyl-diphosphatase